MLPVKTNKTDKNLAPPPGQEENIGNLPYYFNEEIGYKEVISIWKPSEAERKAIAAGQNVRLGVGWIGAFPPVSLGVTPEGMSEDRIETGQVVS